MALIISQSIGNQDQWENENFILYNIEGLRKSKTEYRKKIITLSFRIKNFFFFSFFFFFFKLKKIYISAARVCTDLILLLLFAD